MRIKTEFIYDDDTETVEVLSQEIVGTDEFKDWNLAENRIAPKSTLINKYDVIKCRDLILKDIKEQQAIQRTEDNFIFKIINKRFGDL